MRSDTRVKILTGKYAGAVGVVIEWRENGAVHVRISGLVNGEPVDGDIWFKKSQLEVLPHG